MKNYILITETNQGKICGYNLPYRQAINFAKAYSRFERRVFLIDNGKIIYRKDNR